MVRVDIVHLFRIKMGLCKMSFDRSFRTPDQITRRVPLGGELIKN